MSVYCSPLCDTNESLYADYLASCRVVANNGAWNQSCLFPKVVGKRTAVGDDISVRYGAVEDVAIVGRGGSVVRSWFNGQGDERRAEVYARCVDAWRDQRGTGSVATAPVVARGNSVGDGVIPVVETVAVESGCGYENRVDKKFDDTGLRLDNEGKDKYVPPFKRGPKGGRSIGRGPNYLKNQAARDRRAAFKHEVSNKGGVVVEAVGRDNDGEGSYVDKGKYVNKASFFDGMPKVQVDELQRTRAEAMLAKNRAEVIRQRTAELRATAEEDLLKRELESGAFENRIRTRNEAMDRRSQDQSENIEFYRNARGWAETIKSGEPTPARGPSDVPSLSSGGSPRSESDWELEVKRRDEQNEALRKELDQARKELETYEQSAYDPMKGVVSVYEPCEYVMDGASRFDQAGFMEEYRQKDRARDFSVPLGTHIRPKEEVKLVGM